MNIDRPLDELVKESRLAKRTALADKRKAMRQASKQPSAGPAASTTGAVDRKLAPSKKRGAISKKRRDRKVAATVAAASMGDDMSGTPTGPNPSVPALLAQRLSAPFRKAPRPSKGVKVAVSNLHAGVTQTDIAELFETVGRLKTAKLRLLPDGRSSCEAEVVFERMQDALEAIKRYNMVPLDNQPLHITLATDSIGARSEPVQSRVGKQRARAAGNGRKRNPPNDNRVEYEEEDVSPPPGNGYSDERSPPQEDRQGGPTGGQSRRQNRRRFNRRYQNKNTNANGSANGTERDAYVD